MEPNETLPEKWYITITAENREIVGEYFDKSCDSDCYKSWRIDGPLSSTFGSKDITTNFGKNPASFSGVTPGSVEISFEEFKKWVLKEEPEIITNFPIY